MLIKDIYGVSGDNKCLNAPKYLSLRRDLVITITMTRRLNLKPWENVMARIMTAATRSMSGDAVNRDTIKKCKRTVRSKKEVNNEK